MYRLNIRVSESEYRMLRDLRLALFLESDSAVIRHLITEGYATELAAIEEAKRMKAARDDRQVKLPFSSSSVVEGPPVTRLAGDPDYEIDPKPVTQRPPRKSHHEKIATLARKKKKQAKERGHKSRGLQIPKPKRGAK